MAARDEHPQLDWLQQLSARAQAKELFSIELTAAGVILRDSLTEGKNLMWATRIVTWGELRICRANPFPQHWEAMERELQEEKQFREGSKCQ